MCQYLRGNVCILGEKCHCHPNNLFDPEIEELPTWNEEKNDFVFPQYSIE